MKQRSGASSWIRTLRIVSQTAFGALFLIVLGGAFCAFRLPPGTGVWLGCPLGSLQVRLSSIGYAAGFSGGLILLVAAVFLGRAFCGWACPVGSLLDLFEWAVDRVSRYFSGKGFRRLGTRGVLTPNMKYGVLAGTLAGAPLMKSAIFCPVCPVGTICRSAGLQPAALGAEVAVLPVVAAMSLTEKRSWCRNLCPLGALLALVGRWAPFKVRLPVARCIECRKCEQACPVGCSILDSTRGRLKQDPGVRKALTEVGQPDLLEKPVRFERLPEPVQVALREGAWRYPIRLGECTRCYECTFACPLNAR